MCILIFLMHSVNMLHMPYIVVPDKDIYILSGFVYHSSDCRQNTFDETNEKLYVPCTDKYYESKQSSAEPNNPRFNIYRLLKIDVSFVFSKKKTL